MSILPLKKEKGLIQNGSALKLKYTMIQQQFKELIRLYQRAVEGEPLEELQLFASAVSFLENLKFALQEGDISRQVGMAMIELLSQHSEAYDHVLESNQKRGASKASQSIKEIDHRRELKSKLALLAKDLGEFFRQTEDQPSETEAPHPIGLAPKVKKKPRRLNRQNWLRS